MEEKKLGFISLIGVVVGVMIGSGIFNLPGDMARGGAHSGAILIGWLITGIGMIALALSFQDLLERKPELEGGMYSYARAGFGEYIGFNSAFGYWISAFLGTIASFTFIFNALRFFFPIFEDGNNLPSIIGSSILLWTYHSLVLRGVKEASLVNLLVTIAKLVPIFLFISIVIIAFNVDTFTLDFWGENGFQFSDVVAQTRSTMLVTLWAFLGVEGAVVLSGRAKNKKDVGRATVIALIGTLLIYMLVSVMSLGVLNQAELAELPTPSAAYVLKAVVGPWGAAFINIGLIISLAGALIGWTMLSSEIPYAAAKDKLFPKIFQKVNKNGSPVAALWITSGIMQLIFLLILVSQSTYQTLYFMSGTAMLIPYLFSALYHVKIAIKEPKKGKKKSLIIGIVASIYAAWLVFAAGLTYLLAVSMIYFVGMFVYLKAKKEHNETFFSKKEKIVAMVICVAAVMAIYFIAVGELV